MPTDHFSAVRDLLDAFDRIALEAFHEVSADMKADGTPVTRVDREVTDLVLQALKARFPDHGILSEEEAELWQPQAAWQWVLDPLDGTAMFARGLPVWGMGLGLMHRNEPVEGYLSFPVVGERFRCAGGRLLVNERPFRPGPGNRMPHTRTILVGSDLLRELPLQRVADYKMRNFGTNLYHLMAVALGRAEVMISPRTYLWDLAPALPFTRQRGQVERYLDGTPFRIEDIRSPAGEARRLRQPLLVGDPVAVERVLARLG